MKIEHNPTFSARRTDYRGKKLLTKRGVLGAVSFASRLAQRRCIFLQMSHVETSVSAFVMKFLTG